MGKNAYCLCLILFLFSCGCHKRQSQEIKLLDLGPFKISVPESWNFKDPGEQEDSFVGQITGDSVNLSFDCSSHGYANSLIESQEQYLKVTRHFLLTRPDLQPDTGMHSGSIIFENIDDNENMPANPIDTTVDIAKPDDKQKVLHPKADFIATVNISGKVYFFPVIVPSIIKNHNIVISTNGDYIIKTIWPKIPGKGMTGVYIHSRKSSFNFQMNGQNLSLKNQELALAAFKTIKFK
ncbi:MAG: hypothetical protein V4577_02035 [Bacteroidota bacterium]